MQVDLSLSDVDLSLSDADLIPNGRRPVPIG
jgi:hypothetical protein